MHKTRWAAVCLSLLLLLTLAACKGPDRQEEEEQNPVEKQEPETKQTSVSAPKTPVKPAEPDVPEESDAPEELDDGFPEVPEETEIPDADTAQAADGEYSDEAYDQLVAEVLGSIIDSDMTKLEQAKAIYTYTRSSISYTGKSDKSDWKQGAYTGITTRKGDCFTYYAVSRALLTAAGIDNLEVTRVGGPTSHFWNLVNCGDGWYHFDATPRSKKMPAFDSFMFTDQQAADYTAKAGRSYYSFDGSNLPERVGGPAVTPVVKPKPKPAEEQPVIELPAPADEQPVIELPAPAEDPAVPETSTELPAENETETPDPSVPEPIVPVETDTLPEPEQIPEDNFDTEMPEWLVVTPQPADDPDSVPEFPETDTMQ